MLNVYLTLTVATIEDAAENPIVSVNVATPLQVHWFYSNLTSPVLESFFFNAGLSTLVALSFSGTIRVITLSITAIII